MKKVLYLFIFILSIFTLSSCEFDLESILGSLNNPDVETNNPTQIPTDGPTQIIPNVKKGAVNFFMINDTHGAFEDSVDGYSIARVDTIMDKKERENGDYIKIANGDILQGSYLSSMYYGLPMIEALNEMDFDCFVIGNHEFDWGLDKIEAYADGNTSNGEADFPFLGANIYYANTNTNPEWIKPYTVVEYGDLKVGIIGIIGGYQESSILSTNVSQYTFVDDPSNIVKNYTKILRNEEKCDVVVVSSHDVDDLLIDNISNFDSSSEIDAIFCGHTHKLIMSSTKRIDGVEIPVVQNLDKNETVIGVTLYLNEDNSLNRFFVDCFYTQSTPKSDDFLDLIAKYKEDIESSETVIGYTSQYLNKSTLGRYASQAMIQYSYKDYGYESVDLSILNTGGVRATISSGDITLAGVYNVFPFENKVVLVTMKGSEIKSMLNRNESYLYLAYNNSYSHYSAFDNNTYYKVAVIDYVFTGDYYDEFRNLSDNDYIITDLLMRDLLIDYIKKTH